VTIGSDDPDISESCILSLLWRDLSPVQKAILAVTIGNHINRIIDKNYTHWLSHE
jgi:hypothetical protein